MILKYKANNYTDEFLKFKEYRSVVLTFFWEFNVDTERNIKTTCSDDICTKIVDFVENRRLFTNTHRPNLPCRHVSLSMDQWTTNSSRGQTSTVSSFVRSGEGRRFTCPLTNVPRPPRNWLRGQRSFTKSGRWTSFSCLGRGKGGNRSGRGEARPLEGREVLVETGPSRVTRQGRNCSSA